MGSLMGCIRTLVVWCPDWPVVAAARSGEVPGGVDAPAAVFHANRVVACSDAARRDGVRRGMRRREAQARSPELIVLAHDPGRDARAFEPLVVAVGTFSPLVEIVRPGRCQLAVRGPARYFGGETALVAQIGSGLGALGVTSRSGIADGPYAAMLAAQQGVIVAPGSSPVFLATHPIHALRSAFDGDDTAAGDLRDLIDLFRRLGIRTLGDLAVLPGPDVLGRFGRFGAMLHLLASGRDHTPVDPLPIPPELAASLDLDPPIDRIDSAAFVARTLAEELLDRLSARGLACGRVRITAQTESGEELERLWRHESAGANGGITPTALVDRVRWQLEGWLRARRMDDQPNATDHNTDADDGNSGHALVRITVAPDEVRPDSGRQLDLFGGASASDARAARAFARVQGLLGPAAVCMPMRVGGRSPIEQVTLLPWGDQRNLPPSADAPWPGRLPGPLPAEVPPLAQPADVLDAERRPVRVSSRMALSAPPAWLVLGGTAGSGPAAQRRVGARRHIAVSAEREGSSGARSEQAQAPEAVGGPAAQRRVGARRHIDVVAWAGPWPVDERWWDLAEHRRRARFQLLTGDGVARLVALEGGAWWVEATYA